MCLGFNLGHKVDLVRLVEGNVAFYNPKRLNSAVMFLDESESVKALIFHSGKVTLTGINEEERVDEYTSKVVNLIKDAYGKSTLGECEFDTVRRLVEKEVDEFAEEDDMEAPAYEVKDLKINSMTAKVRLPFTIDLLSLTEKLKDSKFYKEEKRGLTYVSYLNRVRIFNSGSCTYLGIKSLDEANDILKKILPHCESCKLKDLTFKEIASERKRKNIKKSKVTQLSSFVVKLT